MQLSKSEILALLETNDRAIGRALMVLAARQTADERATDQKRHLNGCGFRPCHARMGTSMANFFGKYGRLSEKQVGYWRMRDRAGNMRIGIYWRQLLEAAEAKAAGQREAA